MYFYFVNTSWHTFVRWRHTYITRVSYFITTAFRFRVSDPCLVHYCGRGEECAALGGVARCICVRKCGPAKRRVCGTDGRLYDNRCELHKSGCLSGVDIEIDHSLKCFIPSGESVSVGGRLLFTLTLAVPTHIMALRVPYIPFYTLYISIYYFAPSLYSVLREKTLRPIIRLTDD